MADIKPCGIAEPHQSHSWEQHVVEQFRAFGLYHRCPGVGFPDSMEDLENAVAQVLWEVSRADEGSVSATGASILARSLIAHGFITPAPISHAPAASAEDVLRAMAASDEVANSQSGTLWRFVHKFARQFGVELRASAAELELVTEPYNPREDPNWLNDEIARHAEKQGVSWADAWRHFEREGYKMDSADPQYG